MKLIQSLSNFVFVESKIRQLFLLFAKINFYPFKASAPPTISKISLVIAA
jgi:hypothetical protein